MRGLGEPVRSPSTATATDRIPALLTYAFLHANLVHLLGNMYFLYVTMPLVGASGAIAAVMAAYAILFRSARFTMMFVVVQRRVSAWAWFGLWLAFNFLGILVDPAGRHLTTAFVAHVAGFAFGIAVIWPLRQRLVAHHPLLNLLASGRMRLGLDRKPNSAPRADAAMR